MSTEPEPSALTEPVPERLTLETEGVAIQPRRATSGLLGFGAFAMFLLPLGIMMVGGGIFGMQKPVAWELILSASWLSAIGMLIGAGLSRIGEAARRGRLVIEGGAVAITRGSVTTTVPAGAVVGGSVTPQIGVSLLSLGLADGRQVHAEVPSEAAGRRALEALRIDPMGRPLVGRFKTGALRGLAGFGAMLAAALLGGWLKSTVHLGTFSGVVWLVVCSVLIGAWLTWTRPPEISVGADGVRIRGKAGARFIPLAEIESVKVDGFATLVLHLRGGTEDRTTVALGNGPLLAAVAHRIGLALSTLNHADASATRMALLARGTRSFADWKRELAGRVRRRDYRHAALAEGELEAIVGSASASVEQRLGAAIALREGGGEEARKRIRIAAEQCVNQRVRFALEEMAAGGEDEERAVEEALDAERSTRAAVI